MPPRERNRARRWNRETLIRAITDALEKAGIKDKDMAQRLVDQALSRLEGSRPPEATPLPGMEAYVSGTKDFSPLSRDELDRFIQDLLKGGVSTMAEPRTASTMSPPVAAQAADSSAFTPAPVTQGRFNFRELLARREREGLSKNAIAVLKRRYQAKDRQGQVVETPEQMFRRVARNLAQGDMAYDPTANVEATAQTFCKLMSSLEFLPNSPTIMNAGRDLQQLSACFVLPVPDDMEGIFESAKHTALIHKSGGGTGFSFSRLRPESDVVGSTGGIASGPVSFIKIFDTATDVVKQGGTRRGANMGVLRVDHPDVLKFIHCKDDDRSLQNFNISVAVTRKFMEAVEKREEYDLINPRTGAPSGRLNAREVFDQLVQSAHKTGDPGIIFIDRMNEPRSNPVPKRGPIETTNPCGEQPLYPYDSCNLGSINLARVVAPDGTGVDWAGLERIVTTSVHLLDNVVTMNRYPVPQIEEVSKSIRRIGLGVMGWADLLILLGIPYDSQEALALGEKVMSFIQSSADKASEEMAARRGAFPDWKDSVYGPNGPLGPRPLRNSTRTTIAPTGTISIIADCSSGIEPLFALSFVRNVMDNTKLVEVNPYFEEVARADGFYSDELMRELAERGTVNGMSQVPAMAQRGFDAAHGNPAEWHVRMQAAFQKHTDNAVSKTCNFPHAATAADVEEAYLLAYTSGCKGVTIYRDGSKSAQVLSTGHTEKARATSAAPAEAAPAAREAPVATAGLQPRGRPETMTGLTERVHTGHGTLYVTINFDEKGRAFEVFSNMGKAGGCDAAQLEAVSRLVSLALRSGVDPTQILDQLRGITCCPIWEGGVQIRSAPDAVALALGRHVGAAPPENVVDAAPVEHVGEQQRLMPLAQGHATPAPTAHTVPPAGNGAAHVRSAVAQPTKCPDCNGALVYAEGCLMCHSCGFNKCG